MVLFEISAVPPATSITERGYLAFLGMRLGTNITNSHTLPPPASVLLKIREPAEIVSIMVIVPVIVLFMIVDAPDVTLPLMLLFVIVAWFPVVILRVMVLSVTVDKSPTVVSFVSRLCAIMDELLAVIGALE